MAAVGDPVDLTPERPLRADALRNHRAIVAAAREAFEQVGPDVSLEEVARRAGVGPSTLYRRFTGRDELVAAVFAEYFDEAVAPLLDRAGADPDPSREIAAVVEGIAVAIARHHGVLRAAKDAGVLTPAVSARFMGPLDGLLDRARAAGAVRDDVVARDLPALAMMVVVTAAPGGDPVDPVRWSRYLALVLDGIAPTARRAPLPPFADGS